MFQLKKWAEKILKTRYEKENTYEKIKEAKYDIKENALWLENFYIHSL